MWYFSSDWHLCHTNIIKESRRDFASKEENDLLELADRGKICYSEISIDRTNVEKMNSAIIDSTNSVVKENDSLILLGDFCWSKNVEVARSYLKRLNCKNIFIVWGNHDRPKIMASLFKACYYQYLWTIEGQKIFTSHFPCRVWDRSQYGSWMLYGHCHNSLWSEDNFQISDENHQNLTLIFSECFGNLSISSEQKQSILKKFENQLVKTTGLRLTLDVGVDNRRQGLPFGTPWSFEEVQEHMTKKREAWFSLY